MSTRETVRFALLCLLLGVVPVARAQQPVAAIAGRVVEHPSRRGVADATVSVEGTPIAVRTDAQGRFRIAPAPVGPQVVRVVRLGFAPLRKTIQVPHGRELEVELVMGRNALQLPGLQVTEDASSRAKGELGTATVIGHDAIRNQLSASLAGILELVPGTVLQPPGLDGVQQFSLRAVPVGAGAGAGAGRAGSSSASTLASFGTQVVLDGVPVSNNSNLQSLGLRGELAFASSSGGGIDLRRIPAATIERVEVIRGLPSVRFGDLTQGVVLVETRAGDVDTESRVRADARTVEATVLSGRGIGADHAVTGNVNVARTTLDPGFQRNSGARVSAHLSHRSRLGSTTLDSRVEGFQLLDDQPATTQSPDYASRSQDNGLRMSGRWRARVGSRSSLDWLAAFEGVRQRSFAQEPKLRAALPFTNRLTEGTQDGKFVGGTYRARVDVQGDPRFWYSRLEATSTASSGGMHHALRGGAEMRRESNSGPGYLFDVEFPPQVEFNGVNGYDRPFRFDQLPAVHHAAAYIEDRITRAVTPAWLLQVQSGIRVDALQIRSAVRDHLVQPRIQLELARKGRLRLRGGAGSVAKIPPLSLLFPAPQFYDLVNFNWYANDEAERRAILTTRIADRTNPRLRMARAAKLEAGVELDVGATSHVALVAFRDHVTGGVGIDLEPMSLVRAEYSVDSTTIGQGRPPDVIEPPAFTDSVPVLVDRPANNVSLRSSGLELTALLPEIEALRLRISMQASWIVSALRDEGLDFGTEFSDFQTSSTRERSPYWRNAHQRGERLVLTTRVIHHQPATGLVVTGTVQLYGRERQVVEGGTDTLAFEGFISRNGQLMPVATSERGRPEFGDLRVPRLGLLVVPQDGPVDWLFNIQLSKSLPHDGRFSFYAFNALDRLGTFPGRTTVSRLFPPLRFGVEASVLLGRRQRDAR